MTPQIDHLGIMRTVLRVSKHIYGISKEIDGETFIFRVNQACDPSNLSSRINEPCSEVSTHIYAVSKEIDVKTFIFPLNLGM